MRCCSTGLRAICRERTSIRVRFSSWGISPPVCISIAEAGSARLASGASPDHHTMVSPQSHWGDWRDAPNLRVADRAIVEQTIKRVESTLADFGKDARNYGLIHADLRLTNLLLHKGETRVIDFDDCGFGWYLHDLAAAVSFVEHHPRAAEWIDHWLRGYEQVAHISDDEMEKVPTLLIQRRIQLLAWVGSHAETEMAQSLGPQWADHSVRLCRRYLETQQLPVGA